MTDVKTYDLNGEYLGKERPDYDTVCVWRWGGREPPVDERGGFQSVVRNSNQFLFGLSIEGQGVDRCSRRRTDYRAGGLYGDNPFEKGATLVLNGEQADSM
ncbi:MAG: hypothetical protein ACLSXO_00345 [Coprococcus sp.]